MYFFFLKKKRFELPEFLSVDCCEIITGILRRKPEWRLSMNQVRRFTPNLILKKQVHKFHQKINRFKQIPAYSKKILYFCTFV